MNPESPKESYAAPPGSGTPNNYDFIMGGSTPPPENSGPSKKGRILIALGGVIFLIIAVVIVMSLLSNKSQDPFEEMTALTAQQNELVRVADLGIKTAHSTEAQNMAITTKQTISTDQEAMVAYLKTTKHPVTPAQLELGKKTSTDELLKLAGQNNKFDATFMAVLKSELLNYQQSVKNTYSLVTSKSAKSLLSQSYANINALVGKTKTTDGSTTAN